MGKSVLTPEENLLGKLVLPIGETLLAEFRLGEWEFGQNSETCSWGRETAK
jgi:hypothetical protein